MQMFWERGRRLAQAVRARAGRVFCGALALWVGVMAFSPQRNIPTTLTERTPILIDCDPGETTFWPSAWPPGRRCWTCGGSPSAAARGPLPRPAAAG